MYSMLQKMDKGLGGLNMFARCRQSEVLLPETSSSLPEDSFALVHDGRFHRSRDLDSGSRVPNLASVTCRIKFEPKPKRTEVL